MKQIFCILIFVLLSCNSHSYKVVDNSTFFRVADKKVKLHKLDKLFVIGDFDGNGKQDTIFQHNYSRLTKSEIEYSADPFQNEWDTVVKWFYEQDADLFLTMNSSNKDTLHLGTAQGLYCLINIGDNNADSKDEIALVVDYLDISRINSCKIYTLCNDKWTLLKHFGVQEDSFDYTSENTPIFDSIKGYLENRNGRWFYKDYSKISLDTEEDAGKMKKLILDDCK